MGTNVTLSEKPNLLENYCSVSLSSNRFPLHRLSGHSSQPSCCSGSSFFFQKENKDGLLGLQDLITEQTPASRNTVSVMNLRFHYSFCKKKTKQRASSKEKEIKWFLLLPSAPCCLPFPIFSILLRTLLGHIVPPTPLPFYYVFSNT